MERLPDELLLMTATHCDFDTLKTTRLISHRFLALTTPVVFEHFYMGLFERDLQNLKRLTKTPLAKHVKKLTFFPDIIPEWPESVWRGAIDYRIPFPEQAEAHTKWLLAEPDLAALIAGAGYGDVGAAKRQLSADELSDDRLSQGYKTYIGLIDEQRRWTRRRHGLVFAKLIAKLPSLAEVNEKEALPMYGTAADWPVWKRLKRSIFIGPPFDRYARCLSFYNGRPDFDSSAYVSAIAMAAICEHSLVTKKKHITTLNLDVSTIYHDMIPGMNVTWDQSYLAHALHHVTDLRLHMALEINSGFRHRDFEHRDNLARATMQCLASADHLRRLDLKFTDHDQVETDYGPTSLESLFGGNETIWPNIEEVSLVVDLPATTILKFLSHHANTLKSFALRDVWVSKLENLVQQLPQTVRLENVYFKSLRDGDEDREDGDVYRIYFGRGTDYDDPYERSVKAYLTGVEEAMPQLEWRNSNDRLLRPEGEVDLWGAAANAALLSDLTEDEGEDEFETGIEGGELWAE